MKEKILELARIAFDTKKTHGAESKEFKTAQMSVYEEINRQYQKGDCELIMISNEKNAWGDQYAVRVEKKGNGPEKCSYVRVRIQNKPYKAAIHGRA